MTEKSGRPFSDGGRTPGKPGALGRSRLKETSAGGKGEGSPPPSRSRGAAVPGFGIGPVPPDRRQSGQPFILFPVVCNPPAPIFHRRFALAEGAFAKKAGFRAADASFRRKEPGRFGSRFRSVGGK
ncbi:MAG: hypothetical protein CW346_08870 [Bacillaceae bacterium]|nr:hypothetical protein [Bacillaceae bacterium]